MKITALLENTRSDTKLKSQHGLSLYIETQEMKIIFDTGPSNAYIENAQKLGIDLSLVDTIIISHGHSDHINGLPYFLDTPSLQQIFVSSHIFENHWLKIGPYFHPIGIAEQELSHLQHKIHRVRADTEIAPHVHVITLLNSIPSPSNLYKGPREHKVLDDFNHEMVLVIEEPDGLVVFSGCSHSGITTIIDTINKRFNGKKVKALFGGFHLIKLPYINNLNTTPAHIEVLAKKLQTYNVEQYYSCHCTGPKAFALMQPILGTRLQPFATGTTVTI